MTGPVNPIAPAPASASPTPPTPDGAPITASKPVLLPPSPPINEIPPCTAKVHEATPKHQDPQVDKSQSNSAPSDPTQPGIPKIPSANRSSATKKVGRYKLTRVIGKGGFSTVYHAVDAESKAAYAVKMCEKAQLVENGMLGELENEVAVLKRLKSGHIANLIDVVQTGRYYYLCLDLCETTLFLRITQATHRMDGRPCLPEEDSRRYFQGLLLAVYACHQQGVMHRDIKPENILLTKNDEVKLSDFGFACPVEKIDQARVLCGTRQYLAPEMFDRCKREQNGKFDGFAADVWACGVTLYVCAAGRLPFPEGRDDDTMRQLRQAQFLLPPAIGPELCGVIPTILMPDPSRRPSIFQIMEMPWFRNGFDQHLVDDINKELRQWRCASIMQERYARHLAPDVSTPPLVQSFPGGSFGSPAGGADGSADAAPRLEFFGLRGGE